MDYVVIGSKNPVKVAAGDAAIFRKWPFARVESVDAPSSVGAQPRTAAETTIGAYVRAEYAMSATRADLAIGLEGGVHDAKYGMFLLNRAVALGRDGRIGYGGSAWLQLPERIASEIRKGRELGDVIDEFMGARGIKHKNGTLGVLTDDLVTRQASFEQAVGCALAPFLHPEWY